MNAERKILDVSPWPGRVDVDLWTAPWEAISSISVVNPVGMEPDVWDLPEERFPANVRPSVRQIDFGKIRQSGTLSTSEEKGVIRRAKRMVMLLALRDAVRSGVTLYKPMSASSLAGAGRELVRQIRRRLDHGPALIRTDACPDGLALFSDLGRDWWLDSGTYHTATLLGRLRAITPEDALDDRPVEKIASAADVKADRGLGNETQPYEDEHLTEILGSAFEFSRIGDDLIDLMQVDQQPISSSSRRGRVAERLERFLAYRGRVLGKGYRFLMSPGPMVTGNSGSGAWSPVWLFDDIISPGVALRRLAALAQAANAHLVSFGAGMRPEELNVLTRGCLVCTKPEQGVIRGYRLKDSDAPMGEPRDWPLPTLAVEALQRQERLVKALNPGGEGLWSLVGHRAPAKSTPVTHSVSLSFGGLLNEEGVQLDRGEPFNLKRIRASVARLVALSTQGGAGVLYDVFGHDRMETTMGYMRAKGDLAEEIHEIEDRMRRARIATEVIGARSDQLSGGSAPFVRELLEMNTSAQSGQMSSPGVDAPNSISSLMAGGSDEEAETLKHDEAGAPQDGVHLTGAEDISVAAEILSSAQLVRPGVLCRAVGRFRGACSDQPSVRDVANCAPGCIHRLETSAAIEERRRTLLWHLEALDTSEVRENPFQASFSRSGALTAFGTGQGVEDLMGDDRLMALLTGASASERAGWASEVRKKIEGREV
jgi:integrase